MARGLCRCCYHMAWRDENPLDEEQAAAARLRARMSRLRRIVRLRDEARRRREHLQRLRAWAIVRGLSVLASDVVPF